MGFRIFGGSLPVTTTAALVRGKSFIALVPHAARLEYAKAAAGRLSFTASSYSGIEGTVLQFGVTRTGGAGGTVAVDWAVTGLSQGVPSPSSGTISWNDSEAGPKTVAIQLGLVTANRTGSIVLSNPRSLSGGSAPALGAASASLQIVNLDPHTLLSLSSPSVVEGNSGTTVLRFVLSRAADGLPPISYTAATTSQGTATPGVDFHPFSSSGIIASGQSVNLDVLVIGDTIPEEDETVVMQVTGAWAS